MTNEQLWTLAAVYLGGILSLLAAILVQGRGIAREIALTNRRIDDLRQEMNARLDALTGELRQAIQYIRDRVDSLERPR